MKNLRKSESIKLWKFTNKESGEVLEVHAKTKKGAWGILKRAFRFEEYLQGFDEGELVKDFLKKS
jgi:hypothetical protein